MPIQLILSAFRNQTTQLSSISVISLIIGPLANILYNVMIIRLHYPEKDQVRMWDLVAKYSCWVKLNFWVSTVLLPLNLLGLIVISNGCRSEGYNTISCVLDSRGDLVITWILFVFNIIGYAQLLISYRFITNFQRAHPVVPMYGGI